MLQVIKNRDTLREEIKEIEINKSFQEIFSQIPKWLLNSGIYIFLFFRLRPLCLRDILYIMRWLPVALRAIGAIVRWLPAALRYYIYI